MCQRKSKEPFYRKFEKRKTFKWLVTVEGFCSIGYSLISQVNKQFNNYIIFLAYNEFIINVLFTHANHFVRP